MKRDNMPMFVLAGAVLVAALVLSGVSIGAVLYPLAILACPLMMIFMMRGMDHGGGHSGGCHGSHDAHDRHDERAPDDAELGRRDR